MQVRLGERDGRGVEVGRRRRADDRALRWDTLELALHWLRSLVLPHEVAPLRGLLGELDPAVDRRDDEAALRRIAEALHTGTLVATALPVPTYASRASADFRPTPVELPEPGRGGPPLPAEPEPEPAEIEPLPALDATTQARALQTAAAAGTPFCEICRRASRARAV